MHKKSMMSIEVLSVSRCLKKKEIFEKKMLTSVSEISILIKN